MFAYAGETVSRQVPETTGGVTFSPTLPSLPSSSLPAGIR